jgi:hypothetical protein
MSQIRNKYIGLNEFRKIYNLLERKDVYVSPEWLEILEESYNTKILFLVSSYETEIMAVTPLFVKSKFILKFIGSPLKGFYSDFMGTAFVKGVSEDDKTKIIISVIDAVKKIGSDYCEFRFKNGHYKNIFVNNGYELVKSETLIIETNISKQVLWDSLESRARNMIRKAEKNNICVEFIAHEFFDVSNYYKLLVDTFKRQKSVLHHPKDFFLSLLKEKNSKYVFPVIAKLGEKTVSAAIILRYEKTLFYLSGVSTHEGNQLSANSLIQWKIINYASDNGFTFYDMGGLGIPSIDKFKMSFGGNRFEKIFFVKKSNLFKKIEPIAKLLLEKGFIRFK